MSSNAFYALVDCNCFYVSCERVFRPDLQRKPVVVLSNNDGCVIACSAEAKALGVKRGSPEFKARPLLQRHNIQVFSSNYTLYGDLSARVMHTLENFTPEIEIYSIDECFLVFRNKGREELLSLGRKIRNTVWQWTGIPVSVGFARTKTLAKVANRTAKKYPQSRGVCALVNNRQIEFCLAQFPVEEIWGIGRRNAKKLQDRGIRTAKALRDMPDVAVRALLHIPGLHTVLELRQQPCITLDDAPPPAKSILSSRSFGTPIYDLASLSESLATHAQIAGKKLRRRGLLAATIQVFLRTSKYRPGPQYDNTAGVELALATDDTPELAGRGMEILEQIYKEGYAYQKMGIILLGLVPKAGRQLSLFSPLEDHRKYRNALMRALDASSGSHGKGALQLAAAGMGKRIWHMRQNALSPHYTTRWEELPTAR